MVLLWHVWKRKVEDVDEEGSPRIGRLLHELLDGGLLGLVHDLHGIEASAEDGYGQSPRVQFLSLVGGHVIDGFDELNGRLPELFLIEAILNQVPEHEQDAVQLVVVRLRNEVQQCGQQGRPMLGEIDAGDLAYNIAGGTDDLSVLAAGGQSQQGLAHLFLGGVIDGDTLDFVVGRPNP